MNKTGKLCFFLVAVSAMGFSVVQAETKSGTSDPQQHGTTMMHSSPSDEGDMSHTMHGSPASEAVTSKFPHDPDHSDSGHHADHNMESMQHDGDHGHHDYAKPETSMPSSVNLKKLERLPPSGKSREANYDGTYYMYPVSPEQSLETKCALASRGLLMLDNESWKKCGGKPKGWSTGITPAPVNQ